MGIHTGRQRMLNILCECGKAITIVHWRQKPLYCGCKIFSIL